MKRYLRLLLFLLVFGLNYSNAQNGWIWGDGGKGAAQISGLSTDREGNCFAFGLFHYDTVQIGSYTFPDSTVNLGFFLLKLAPNGSILWAKNAMNKSFAPENQPFNCGMTTDMAGNSYCAGSFSDTIIFGSTTLINNLNINYNFSSFLVKYDPSGNVKWAGQFYLKGDTSDIAANVVSTDLEGNLFVAGLFSDTATIGSYVLTSPRSSVAYYTSYPFLIKYDSSGNLKWAKQATGKTQYGGEANGIANDRYGNSYLTGVFADTIVFGQDTLIAENPLNNGPVFIIKYDSSGNTIWARQSLNCNTGRGYGYKITTDLFGNAYVLGTFSDTIVFVPDTLIANNFINQSIFIVKYDPNGNVIWAKQLEILDKSEWWPDGLSVDKYNHVYFSCDGGGDTGTFRVKFGDSVLETHSPSPAPSALCVFKIDSNANVICGNIIPGGGNDGFDGLASDSLGNFTYVSGFTRVPLVFGQDSIDLSASLNNTSIFIARWEACDGNLTNSIPQNIKPTEQVNLYPNPNNGRFNIQWSFNSGQSSLVEVYNMLGEKVFTEILRSTQNYNLIDLSNQPAGLYLYRVTDMNGGLIGSGKFVIAK